MPSIYESLDNSAVPVNGTQVTARVDEYRTAGDTTLGLFPDRPGGTRAEPIAFDWTGAPNFAETMMMRSAPQSEVAALPISPVTTAVVLGTLRPTFDWVNLFFPRLSPVDAVGQMASSKDFQFPVWGTEHLEAYDTLLPEGAPYQMSGLDVAWLSGELESHGWATPMTFEEQARASNLLGWREKKAELPMFVVKRGMEFLAASILTNTAVGATFAPDHILDLAPGAEWDRPGTDMQADVGLAISAILQNGALRPEDLLVVYTRESLLAAQRNDGFRAWHSGVLTQNNSETTTTEMRLKEYLGVGEVTTIQPIGAAGQPLFADLVWVVHQGPRPGGQVDTNYGTKRFGARFALNDGFLMEPWVERMIRTNVQASYAEYELHVMGQGQIYLITNTSSAV